MEKFTVENGRLYGHITLDKTEFKIRMLSKTRINWKTMSKKQKIKYAKAYRKEYGIRTFRELETGPHKNPGMATVLQRGKLTAIVFDRPKTRSEPLAGKTYRIPLNVAGRIAWSKMSKRQTIAYAKAYCLEFGITGSAALCNGPRRHQGLYRRLRQKVWIADVFPRSATKTLELNGTTHIIPVHKNSMVNWELIDNKKLVSFALDYLAEHGIVSRSQLKRKYHSLYTKLHERKKIDEVLPPLTIVLAGIEFRMPRNREKISWRQLTNDKVLAYARAYRLEFNIATPAQMSKRKKTDKGLYKCLLRRALHYTLFGLPKERQETLGDETFALPLTTNGDTHWKKMSDKQIEKYAFAYCRYYVISYGNQLRKQNEALLVILSRRKLLAKLLPGQPVKIVELEGRRFGLAFRGKQILWANMDRQVLQIYAALVCRAKNIDANSLPAGLLNCVSCGEIRLYIRKLPVLDLTIAAELRLLHHVNDNYDIPEELLWAYGFERYEDKAIRMKAIRRIVRPETD